MISIAVYNRSIDIENLYNGIFFYFDDIESASTFIKKCVEENHPIIIDGNNEE